MKPTLPPPTSRRSRSTAARRQQWLAAFDRSGLSAAAFAHKHQLAYSTFCQWRQRRDRGPAVSFTEVEILRPRTPEPLVLELGPQVRVRLSSPDQLELAAGLLKLLQASC